MSEHYIGLISGTSLDAVDAVLVEFDDDRPKSVIPHSHPLPTPLKLKLQAVTHGESITAAEFGRLDAAVGRLFCEAAQALIQNNGIDPSAIRAIGSHGQTLFHGAAETPAFTIQIGDPNLIAEGNRITTVADFRRRDMAAGGQGAPLVPAFHNAAFRSRNHDRVILNIGGIANVTLLPADPTAAVRGFDTGPGNGLMDAWASRHLNAPMDLDGNWASQGNADPQLLERLLSDPYFSLTPPKSSGREYFHLQWLQQYTSDQAPEMIQATLLRLTVESISRAIEAYAPGTEELYVCGGGSHNSALMKGLKERLPQLKTDTTQTLGVDPDWVEAIAFAWLAKRTLEGKPGNLPDVTGAKHPVVLGAIYPA